MIEFGPGKGGRKVLALGAHCDDIEIGCGGTMLRLAADPSNEITWVVFSSNATRRQEVERSAAAFLGDAPNRRLLVHDFRDGYLPWSGADVKDRFEALKGDLDPDLIFTHYRDDMHQDHRLVSELTWNTFRDHAILEYEIPKWDGDFGRPNAFVALDDDTVARKCAILVGSYTTQAGKPWFSAELFRALALLRGMECRAPERLAEAFYAHKIGISI